MPSELKLDSDLDAHGGNSVSKDRAASGRVS